MTFWSFFPERRDEGFFHERISVIILSIVIRVTVGCSQPVAVDGSRGMNVVSEFLMGERLSP